jgi:N-acetylglucosamine kinase-like BadF-type ATPase
VDRAPLVELPAVLAREQPRSEVRYLLGVDGGATKTLAAVYDLEGGTVHLGHGGPSNEDAVGERAAVEELLAASGQAAEAAGIALSEVGSAVLAVAGTDTEALAKAVREMCDDTWIVVNDVIAAWATATGAAPGVAAIAGTGSNVFGVGEDGVPWRAGGWGHVLGDEGSGYWVGVHAIHAAMKDRDGSGRATQLAEAAARFFSVPRIEDVAALVYAKPLTKSELAAFAIVTARAAENGDGAAREVLERGARELGAQILAVITHTGLRGAFQVGLIGSAFKAGAIFVDPLRDVVRRGAPDARVEIVETAPVAGSLVLAARACGRSAEVRLDEVAALVAAD